MKNALLYIFLVINAWAAPRPNIIYILTDDLGWGDLGVYHQNARRDSGDRSLPSFATPQLDRMAANGARFNAHYVAAPVCVASRASFLQGVHQGHTAVRDNQFDKALDANHTVGTVLQRAGYATALIGKWGLQGRDDPAPHWSAHPRDRGFDYYYGYMRHIDGHEHYPKEMIYFAEKARRRGPVVVWENHTDVTAPLDRCYSTDLFTARAKKWIVDHTREHPAQPFFLLLSYATPHAALELPAEPYPAGGGLNGGLQWLGFPGRAITTARGTPDSWIHPEFLHATYDHDRDPRTTEILWPEIYQRHATAVRRLDDATGDLLQLLKDLQIDENTLVIFTSDNGPAAESYLPQEYHPDFFGSYGPFDGIKRDLWEGGLRTPTLVQWPAYTPRGLVVETAVANWDWLATFADVAGIAAPARTDGRSIFPLITRSGSNEQPRSLYFEYAVDEPTPNYAAFEASRRGRPRRQTQAIREGEIMAVRYNIVDPDTPFQIYDVVRDPKQTRDVATPSLNQHFLWLAARSRRASPAAPRPYDEVPHPPEEQLPRNLMKGLYTQVASGEFPWVPHTSAFGPLSPTNASGQARRQTGFLVVPTDGDYEFTLQSTHPACIKLNQTTLIDADFNHQPAKLFVTSIRLRAGLHAIDILRLAADDSPSIFDFRWSGPSFPSRAFVEADYRFEAP